MSKQFKGLQIQTGIPQGSVMGPIFYLITTSNISTTSNITIEALPDDAALLATSKNPNSIQSKLQNQLLILQSGLEERRIRVNENSVHLNETKVPKTHAVKQLGMTLIKTMSFTEYKSRKKKQYEII